MEDTAELLQRRGRILGNDILTKQSVLLEVRSDRLLHHVLHLLLADRGGHAERVAIRHSLLPPLLLVSKVTGGLRSETLGVGILAALWVKRWNESNGGQVADQKGALYKNEVDEVINAAEEIIATHHFAQVGRHNAQHDDHISRRIVVFVEEVVGKGTAHTIGLQSIQTAT